ncbi:hypothetical protein V5E97_14590 [Singulisphaera sp. Ch08]|uniref:Carbohydrate-binding domain-containing protein n=1 Tax=Singulisphaera sp. Ch08 TaxID=3120278 RepID=A0AAU7CP70_9BACT
MTTPLLPQAFWFRLSVPCRHVSGIPKTGAKGGLLGLDASCSLPKTTMLDDKPDWADVRVAWNQGGLAIQVETAKSTEPTAVGSDEDAEGMHGIQVWVDTRDTRNVSRATRFCHRFSARLLRGKTRSALAVEVSQRPIARAVADAPLCRPEILAAHAERLKQGWRIEMFLPAEAFQGFDPETNRRLGFAYQVTDHDREDQFLGVGREFPVGENPSLWTTLELRD